jgi:hypothetical protein
MPCRWAIPNTSAMARYTTSRLGSRGLPILFIALSIKGLPSGEKNGRMGPTFLLRASSKSPNSSSNFGPSGCANRMHKDFPHSAEMLGHQSGQNCTLE